ncbi:hypothetical protein THAOC_30643, partial [Thalassiosira oceanica]
RGWTPRCGVKGGRGHVFGPATQLYKASEVFLFLLYAGHIYIYIYIYIYINNK